MSVFKNKGKDLMFEYFHKDFSYTALNLIKSAKVLLCGTSRGSICVHLWPPVIPEKELRHYRTNQLIRDIEFYEFQSQLYPINHLTVTPKHDSLIVISNDGMTFILKMDIKDKPEQQEQKTQIQDKGGIAQTVNELFLVKNSYIKQQMRAIREKEMEVARYEKKKITDAENKNRENKAKLAKIDKYTEQSKQNCLEHQARFLAHSEENIRKQTEKKHELEDKLNRKLQEMEEETADCVAYEQGRNKQLREDFEKLKSQKKGELEGTAKEQIESQSRLNHKFVDNLNELQSKYEAIMRDASKYGDEFLKKIALQEQEHENELNRISAKLTEVIAVATKENEEWQAKNAIQNAESENNKSADVNQQRLFEQEFIRNTKLQEEKVKIVVDLLKIQEQLLEREQVVFSKDETIKMARDEQINLENFQFMLDQKIKSLKSNKTQLDDEIDLREKILRDMFNELIKQSQQNNLYYNRIKERLQKMQILKEQNVNVELKIYYWSLKIKDYHRKIMAKINAASKTSEVKMLVNKLISDSNIEQAKNLDGAATKEHMIGLTGSSSDVGTSVHRELIEHNTWLINKLNAIEEASDNIKKIREEKIETGLSHNKKLIEECNKLTVDNDFLQKQYNHYRKMIENFKKEKEAMQREINRSRKFGRPQEQAGHSQTLLPRILHKHDQENTSELRPPSKKTQDSRPAGPPSGVGGGTLRSSSQIVLPKKPVRK